MTGWGLRRIVGFVLALCLAACGPAGTQAAKGPDRPLVHPDGFDPRELDLARPCTLMREVDAERISNQPFYRTLATNRVEEDRVRCAHAVGAGGLHSLVEASAILPAQDRTPEEAFAALCGAVSIAGPQPAARAPEPEDPAIRGRSCRLANASYAILAHDGVVVAMVRGGAGEVRPGESRRLAAILASRVAVGR